jgi:hypothetical protein
MDQEETNKQEVKARHVVVEAYIAPRLNAAFHQNSVPAIAEINLVNDTDDDLTDLTISISATPPFLQPRSFRFERVQADSTQRLNPVPVNLNAKFLLSLTEAILGEIDIVAKVGETELTKLTTPCQVLSPSEWTGLSSAPELIAAFVRPNDHSVDAVLRNAAEKLRRAGRDPSVDGYRTRKKARAWELVESIWAALCDERIVYALPPQSFERNGQKIRSPSAILDHKLGTCLDLALLLAACVEQAGLNPLVGFSEGHAFCGIWLANDEFSLGVVDEAQTLRKRIQLEELILVETSLLTNQPPVKFSAAVERASGLVAEDSNKRFELMVDVRRARHRQIKPLAIGADAASSSVVVSASLVSEATLEVPPVFVEEQVISDSTEGAVDRLERWKRKLLDLSLRNKLLNFKVGSNAVALVCPNPGSLEDKLAAGETIKVLPRANLMSGADPRSAELHFRHVGEDAARRYAAEALRRGDVHANLDQEDLNDRLTEIFRSARTSFEEGGANSLHLAVGFVSWLPEGKGQACKAPLLLLPVALERRTTRSGFRLVRHDDDARINPTLLQMLRQDFKLIIPEFERELPVDASGLDVAQIWRVARSYLKDVRGFELTEEVILSNFSFVKYLMWKDLTERAEMLKRNPVVRHLIDTPTAGYGDLADLPDEHRLDNEINPRDLFTPLPADSSQTAAVVAGARGKDFVLFGPPGTGKSQTIANMIIQLMADGKTVLFVSQKTTALEVVRKRLTDVGLGSFCLEVHSAKAQKSSVLTQLKNTWEFRAGNAVSEWDETTADLQTLCARLNAVVRALHRRRKNGLSAHQALGRAIAARDFLPAFKLAFASPDEHEEADLRRLRECCRSLRTSLAAIGDPSRHSLRGVGRTRWSPIWQNELVAMVQQFQQCAVRLARATGEVAALFDVHGSGDPRWILNLLGFASQLFKPEAASATALLGRDGAHLCKAFAAWKDIKTRYSQSAALLAGTYRPGVFQLDFAALLGEWREASNAIFLARARRKKAVWEALVPFTDAAMPEDVGGEIAGLMDLKELAEAASQYDQTLSALGGIWRGLSTDVAEVEAHFTWAETTRATVGTLANSPLSAVLWLETQARLIRERRSELSQCRVAVTRLLEAYKSFEVARIKLVELAEAPNEWLGLPVNDEWLIKATTTMLGWESDAAQLPRWCKWREAAQTAQSLGLYPIVSALSSGAITSDEIISTFEIGYARWWIEQIVEREDALRGFVADQQNDTIAYFAEIDAKVAVLAQRVVAGRLSGNLPPRTAFGRDPEFGMLAREIEKRSRHMPLRQLFGHMPTALTKLAPCMMMSPLSIAQYLPADAKPFDVVIFDEASQIPVWDAIGAIARGKQVIVVGDPKQLPPTSFFDRSDEGYDDASDLDDLESILDECLAANIPHKRLTWHYRSRHESLITFSNERYYEGRLITFPSPVTDDRAVRYTHVPGGTYERGSGRVNREEARAVVKDVVQRLIDPAFAREERSLGIVTFNTEQQRLIENLLDQERRGRPELDRFFGREWHEPVFIKNLESVQGDERDAILFSVGYGPDASGRVSQNFGPLNKDGGTRRLNVAITRARSELVVFATLKPDQIDLSRTKAAGVRDFKHFLEYAVRGRRALAEAAAPLDRDTDSPFEDAVRHALEDCGWIVHPQVGVAGFRIDLGIVHPDAPGRYLAGIECDGATYHRSATARDRDLLRERVLRNLGWRIYRVWSMDWWVDADRATAMLNAALSSDLEDERQQEPEATVATEEETWTEHLETESVGDAPCNVAPAPTIPDEPEASEIDAEPVRRYAERAGIDTSSQRETVSNKVAYRRYQVADLEAAGFKADRDAFYDAGYRPALRRMVAHVISVEGPIFYDLLVHRVARAHGFGRAAGKIREIILDVIEQRFPRTSEGGRKIVWPEGTDTTKPPSFRYGSLDDRNHVDVPLVELASLARRFLDEGGEPEEAAVLIGREFGLGRLRESTRVRFEQAARLARNTALFTPEKNA